MLRLIKKTIHKIRIEQFRKGFYHIGSGSGFGVIGYGDTCRIWDCSRISIGNNTWIGRNSVIQVIGSYPDSEAGGQQFHSSLWIGDDVHCTESLRVLCAGNMAIGNHVLIAPNVFICDNNHGLDPTKEDGYRRQNLTVEDVKICDGVWIGQGAYIMPGVTIGEHSIIGANSVVTHDIPAYSIAAGSPARVFKRWNFKSNRWERVDNESTE